MDMALQQQIDQLKRNYVKYTCPSCGKCVYLDSVRYNGRTHYCPFCSRKFRSWTAGFSFVKWLFPGDETLMPDTALKPSDFLRKIYPHPPRLPSFNDHFRIPVSEWIRAGESDDPAGYMDDWISPNYRERLKSYLNAVIEWRKKRDSWMTFVDQWDHNHGEDKVDIENLPEEVEVPTNILMKYGG